MTPVENEEKLLECIIADVSAENVIIQAGHVPLSYEPVAHLDFEKWGAFTPYSLDLGFQLATRLREAGHKPTFAFVVDDITYAPDTSSRTTRMRRSFFKRATLPELYASMLAKYNFSEADVLQQKRTNGISPLFSEKTLRAEDLPEENYCARAYMAFLMKHVPQDAYLVSFIPDRCTSNICSRVLDVVPTNASHVFMQTEQLLLGRTNVEDIWKWGVVYRKD